MSALPKPFSTLRLGMLARNEKRTCQNRYRHGPMILGFSQAELFSMVINRMFCQEKLAWLEFFFSQSFTYC